MRCAVLVVALAALVSAEYVKINTNYFDAVGIPLAQKIRAQEEALLSQQQENADGVDSRIIGGVVAPLGAYPYMAGLIVALTTSPWQGVCGSTLLSANRLVTAAHCWNDGVRQAWQFTVVLGSQTLFTGGTRITTSQVVMHPQWTWQILMNDVAVIYLPQNVLFTSTIFPVSLPSGVELFDTFEGQIATAVGYGVTSDAGTGVPQNTQARAVNVRVMSVNDCQQVYGSIFVTSSTLCTSGAGFVGVCGGDSGGPLVVQRNGVNTLIGITSFAADGACTQGHPSGFARVTSFYNFIMQNL